jgi:hypothetical protein
MTTSTELMKVNAVTDDNDLSEDSMFVCSVQLPDEQHAGMRPYTYLGVAGELQQQRACQTIVDSTHTIHTRYTTT